MKILIIANRLDGGTGTFVSQFSYIQKLFPHTYNTRVISLERPLFRLKTFLLTPTVFYEDSYRLSRGYKSIFKVIGVFTREFLWSLREVKNFNPDIVLTLDTHCAFLGCFIKIFHPKTKFVATFHNNVSAVSKFKLSPVKRRIMILVCHYLLPLANDLVGVSHGVSEDVRHLFRLKKSVCTIYNGIEISHTAPMRVPKKQNYYIAASGRLSAQKDFTSILQAVKLLVPQFPKLELHIFGDGENRRALTVLTHHLNISRHVVFHGWVHNITRYLKQTDMYVLSSVYEGFSFALLEAMSVGLPVVATNTPFGPAEILNNGEYGLLVAPSDARRLAEAIASLLQDPLLNTQFRLKAIQRSRYFNRNRMALAYHQLFTKRFS